MKLLNKFNKANKTVREVKCILEQNKKTCHMTKCFRLRIDRKYVKQENQYDTNRLCGKMNRRKFNRRLFQL